MTTILEHDEKVGVAGGCFHKWNAYLPFVGAGNLCWFHTDPGNLRRPKLGTVWQLNVEKLLGTVVDVILLDSAIGTVGVDHEQGLCQFNSCSGGLHKGAVLRVLTGSKDDELAPPENRPDFLKADSAYAGVRFIMECGQSEEDT